MVVIFLGLGVLTVRPSDGLADPSASNRIGEVVDSSSDHSGPAVADTLVDEFIDQCQFCLGEATPEAAYCTMSAEMAANAM